LSGSINDFNNSSSPLEFIKNLTKQAVAKNYLENKAMFNIVQNRDKVKSDILAFKSLSPAGIPRYGKDGMPSS
jgi:hypothetical protein|tara:strand:+ start:1635 stop:1853 length:219 start_codon:yes stop_codon:yes gene_type:complete